MDGLNIIEFIKENLWIMPVYEYIAYDSRGKNKKGIIDADSAVAARQKLRRPRSSEKTPLPARSPPSPLDAFDPESSRP
jgi:hypothetical protein